MSSRLTTLREPFLGITVLLVIIISCAISSSHGQEGPRECAKFFMGFSRHQPQLSGHYELLKHTFNNRLVYRHSCSQYYLFHDVSAEDGNVTRWVLGTGVGRDVKLYVKSHDTRLYPWHVTSWQTRSRENENWVEDGDIFVTCIDSYVHRHCRSVSLRGPAVPQPYQGPYTVDGFHDNHVKYKHEDGKLYLFHYDDGACKRWIVGPRVGENRVSMQTLSNSSSPFEIREKWMIAASGQLSPEIHTVQVHCQGYEDDVPTCGARLRRDNTAITPYIYNAKSTYPGKWPFMVSYVRPDGVHKCGASLISKRWVLTAGHCVSQSYINRAYTGREMLRMGAYDLHHTSEKGVVTIKIKEIHLHPLFTWVLNPFRLNYDLALMELSEDVIYSDTVQPACLMEQNEDYPLTDPNRRPGDKENYTNCHIVGWGQTSFIDGVGGRLQDVPITRIMGLEECHDVYYNNLDERLRSSTSVCLFGKEGGRMCKGDSGSPLFCEKDGRWTLLGLGGWSVAQCIDMFFYYPSVYTDLSLFRDWIIAIMHGYD